MLEAGYTAVAEFHYLHHQPDGHPYDEIAELSERVIAAPTRPASASPTPGPLSDRRFRREAGDRGPAPLLNPPERFLKLVESVRGAIRATPRSPWASPPFTPRRAARCPGRSRRCRRCNVAVHIHVAEQTGEVEQCLAWSGQRPVEWLLAHASVDRRWCLVHATHVTPEEVRAAAAAGTVAGLCPTTEANLGDGFFPAEDWLAARGTFGIGSDSHISVSFIEELRWLEYDDAVARRRNRLTTRVGALDLHQGALSGGAQASGRAIGRIASAPVPISASSTASPRSWRGAAGAAARRTALRRQRQSGEARDGRRPLAVRDGRHFDRDAIRQRYRRAAASVRERL